MKRKPTFFYPIDNEFVKLVVPARKTENLTYIEFLDVTVFNLNCSAKLQDAFSLSVNMTLDKFVS